MDDAANHLRDVLELAELRLTFVIHVGCKSKPFADVHGARTGIRLKAMTPALKVASELGHAASQVTIVDNSAGRRGGAASGGSVLVQAVMHLLGAMLVAPTARLL